MPQLVHVGDIGTRFIAVIKDGKDIVDISSATVKRMKFMRKDKTTFQRDAVFSSGSGADGQLIYITQAGDIDKAGDWSFQAYVELSDWEGHSDKAQFTVEDNIQVTESP